MKATLKQAREHTFELTINDAELRYLFSLTNKTIAAHKSIGVVIPGCEGDNRNCDVHQGTWEVINEMCRLVGTDTRNCG